MSSLKEQITSDMKVAMKAKDKPRLDAVRLILAAIKQVEIDKRIELNDTDVLSILNKLAKQRRESITQYEKANRDDLIATEQYELGIISGYLPEPLSDAEVDQFISDAIEATNASGMRDMGKVMAFLKEKLEGRANMGVVSQRIKDKLN